MTRSPVARGGSGSRLAAPVGVAMLGYGAIADLHASALRQAGARLIGVGGPSASEVERFAARHGFEQAAESVEAAVDADGVELVVIASPSQVHAAQARHALEQGRHVLVEIPLALSLRDGEDLVALADRAQRILGVCHTLRFWEPYQVVRSAIAESGATPTHVVARRLTRRVDNVGWTGRTRTWMDDLLWHHGGHVIDLCLAFLRAPVAEVSAAAGSHQRGAAGPADYAISLRTIDGGIASIALSYNALISASDYVVITDNETFAIEGARARSSRATIFEGERRAVERRAVENQDAAMLHALRGGPDYPAEARSILPTLRVQDVVARSTGRE